MSGRSFDSKQMTWSAARSLTGGEQAGASSPDIPKGGEHRTRFRTEYGYDGEESVKYPSGACPLRIEFRRLLRHDSVRLSSHGSLNTTMHVPGLRSAYVKTGGIVYFARMLDKIRLQAAGRLPPGYNLGVDEWLHFDSRCTRFLGVSFETLVRRVLRGGSNKAVLLWCFKTGRRPSDEEIEIWNGFMQKRGWQDGSSAGLEKDKQEAGLAGRNDILTWFDLFDDDERRRPKKSRSSPIPR